MPAPLANRPSCLRLRPDGVNFICAPGFPDRVDYIESAIGSFAIMAQFGRVMFRKSTSGLFRRHTGVLEAPSATLGGGAARVRSRRLDLHKVRTARPGKAPAGLRLVVRSGSVDLNRMDAARPGWASRFMDPPASEPLVMAGDTESMEAAEAA